MSRFLKILANESWSFGWHNNMYILQNSTPSPNPKPGLPKLGYLKTETSGTWYPKHRYSNPESAKFRSTYPKLVSETWKSVIRNVTDTQNYKCTKIDRRRQFIVYDNWSRIRLLIACDNWCRRGTPFFFF